MAGKQAGKLVETWRPIPEWEGSYEVSDQGRVRSFRRDPRGLILRPGTYTATGHVSVSLGRGNMRPVHLLVLSAFVGPLPKGAETRHINGDATDNRLENLRYGSRSENLIDAQKHGVGRAKLTVEQVLAVRKAHEGGVTMTSQAERYGVSVTTISYLLSGKTYWWVP